MSLDMVRVRTFDPFRIESAEALARSLRVPATGRISTDCDTDEIEECPCCCDY